MFKLSSIFREGSEEYLIIPAVKQFLQENEIPFNSNAEKKVLLDSIEAFANSSAAAEEKVSNWLDTVLREGIREIQIERFELTSEMEILFSSDAEITKYLSSFLTAGLVPHFCGNDYSGEYYQFFKFDLENAAHGHMIRLYFCKKMQYAENKNGVLTSRVVDFPIIVEVYLDFGWYCIRYKNRSSLFKYDAENGYTVHSLRISMQKEIKQIDAWIHSKFHLEKLSVPENSRQIRQKLFTLLDRYTHTPQQISTAMDNKSADIQNLIQRVIDICDLHSDATDNITEDIKTLVEKYLSVYWPDSKIFTNDRAAYPIHLSVKDEESSQVDQWAGFNRPLQMCAVFFDNKKMLYKQKSCEAIQFNWKRENASENDDVFFPVKIYEHHGRCCFKFSKYTSVEDIENVLFAIIDA